MVDTWLSDLLEDEMMGPVTSCLVFGDFRQPVCVCVCVCVCVKMAYSISFFSTTGSWLCGAVIHCAW
jgi:hypothetical protein